VVVGVGRGSRGRDGVLYEGTRLAYWAFGGYEFQEIAKMAFIFNAKCYLCCLTRPSKSMSPSCAT